MPYNKTTWYTNLPPYINGPHLNNLESQYETVMEDLPAKIADSGDPIGAALDSKIVSVLNENGGGVAIFEFGANANAIRPVTSASVIWSGTVQPNNMVNGDVWLVPTSSIATPTLVSTVAPAITGTGTVGQTLTGSNGTWTAAPDYYAYQWYADGVAIGGAAGATYVVGSGDVGKVLTFRVIASKSGYINGTATSTGVTANASPPPAFPTTNLTGRWELYDMSEADGAALGTVPNRVSGGNGLAPVNGVTMKITSGHKAARFNGTNQYMDATLASSQPHTRIFLAKYLSAGASKPFVGSAGVVASVGSTSGTKWSLNNGTALVHPDTTDLSWHVIIVYSNGATSEITVNDVKATGPAGSNVPTGWRVAATSSLSAFASMEFAAGAQYSGALSDADIAAIKANWAVMYPGTFA